MEDRREVLKALDDQAAELMERQLMAEDDPRCGGFWREDFYIESRDGGFFLSKLIAAYVTEGSRWYLHPEMERAIRAALAYVQRCQREDGCFDLTLCNFSSAPDTAFMINALLLGYLLLENCRAAETVWLRKPLRQVIDRACDGITHGGFHTPNHRWAIASCLLTWVKCSGRAELADRAAQYLREGLDITADGEFSERSAGNYNQVNDDLMLRLYLATGEQRFLDAAVRNLEMMRYYIDPDQSVFTNNSTRWDMGQRVYTESYYILYLLAGHLAHRDDLRAMARWIRRDAQRRSSSVLMGENIQWLLLYPDMRDDDVPMEGPLTDFSRAFHESGIVRMRHGAWSCSLMMNKPNFLYFQHGAFTLVAAIYANLCDMRNFMPSTLEKTEHGWRITAHAAGWYYLPYPEAPKTSDWWQMDNEHTRPRMEGMPLDTTVEITEQPDGIDLHIRTTGVDRLPLRLELGFLPGGYIRTEHFVQDTLPGMSIHAMDGTLEAAGPGGETIVVGPCFNTHGCKHRMGGAYPVSDKLYTVFMNDVTPVDRTICIRAARKDRRL